MVCVCWGKQIPKAVWSLLAVTISGSGISSPYLIYTSPLQLLGPFSNLHSQTFPPSELAFNCYQLNLSLSHATRELLPGLRAEWLRLHRDEDKQNLQCLTLTPSPALYVLGVTGDSEPPSRMEVQSTFQQHRNCAGSFGAAHQVTMAMEKAEEASDGKKTSRILPTS